MRSPALAFALIAATATARAQPASVPADLADYGLICFCNSRVATPHGIVGMDNNGRILKLLRTPMTKAEIAQAGEPVLDSQLRMLRDWGLVERKGDKFATAFPVLGPAEMAALRARLAPAAERVAAGSASDIERIAAELQRRGQAQSGQAVLFGYVLDGLVWRQLEERGRLPSLELDVHHPYWAGTFWAVYPKQDHMPGTNEYSVEKAKLRMMWTPPVVHQYPDIVNDPEIKTWLESLGATTPGAELPAAPAASPVKGAVIVDERAGDPLHVHGKAIAHRVAEAMVNARLDDVIPNADESQQLLIATHEFVWLVLDHAARDHGIAQPAVARTGSARLGDLAPLFVAIIPADTP